jgi:hypothetical protein
VKGSHGLVGNVPAEGPVVIADASLIQQDQYVGADVYSLIWASLQSQ